jgi:hypothetical protein
MGAGSASLPPSATLPPSVAIGGQVRAARAAASAAS